MCWRAVKIQTNKQTKIIQFISILITHPFTQSTTHPSTQSPNHQPIYLPNHISIPQPNHAFIPLPDHQPFHHSCTSPSTHPTTQSFMHLIIHTAICPITRPSLYRHIYLIWKIMVMFDNHVRSVNHNCVTYLNREFNSILWIHSIVSQVFQRAYTSISQTVKTIPNKIVT
jgi:hypothetical protein